MPLTAEDVRRIAGEAVGHASMCWRPRPSAQVFDSEEAVKVVDRLVRALEKNSSSHMQFCKRCDKAHVPRCDKCGKSVHDGADMRSYHGPCGKCAFPKKAMVEAFTDELSKIAGCGNYQRVGMSDDQEQLDAIRINAHFFHKDNTSMHPAHRRLFKIIETAADAQLQQDGLEKGSAVKVNIGNKIITHTGKWLMRQGANLKSLPGRMGSAAAAHLTPIESMKAGLKHNLDPKTGGGLMGRGLFLAGTAASGLQALPEHDPMGQGESRLTRALRAAGGTATGLIASPFGAAPSIAFGIAGDVAGGKVGRMIDKARGYKPPVRTPPVQVQGTPALVPPKRIP